MGTGGSKMAAALCGTLLCWPGGRHISTPQGEPGPSLYARPHWKSLEKACSSPAHKPIHPYTHRQPTHPHTYTHTITGSRPCSAPVRTGKPLPCSLPAHPHPHPNTRSGSPPPPPPPPPSLVVVGDAHVDQLLLLEQGGGRHPLRVLQIAHLRHRQQSGETELAFFPSPPSGRAGPGRHRHVSGGSRSSSDAGMKLLWLGVRHVLWCRLST